MKRYLFALSVCCVSVILLSSCASSERMMRMSGGVFGTYAPPRDHRIRSEFFHEKLPVHDAPGMTGAAAGVLPGTDRKLVNIWPFYFRSTDYTAALWPFFDFDDYGFAVRPFFNKEGDEYAVLFPLCGWNTSAGEGWCLNFFWDNHRDHSEWIFLPFAGWCGDPEDFKSWCFPLWMYFAEKDRKDIRNVWRELDEDFLYMLIAYGGSGKKLDADKLPSRLLTGSFSNAMTEKGLLAYELDRAGVSMPEDEEEYLALQQHYEDNLPLLEKSYRGVFPLFHWERDYDGGWELDIAGGLLGSFAHDGEWDLLLRILAFRSKYEYFFAGGKALERKDLFVAPALLSGWNTRERIDRTPAVQHIEKARSIILSGNDFDKLEASWAKELRMIDPDLEIPASVTDVQSAEAFTEDFAETLEYTYSRDSNGFVLPLGWWNYDGEDDYSWVILPLLTGAGSADRDDYGWMSLPLFSWHFVSPGSKSTVIASPLVYTASETAAEKIKSEVMSRDVYWSSSSVVSEDVYFFCGLYFRGKDKFMIAREGVDREKIEKARRSALEYADFLSSSLWQEENFREREMRIDSWQVTDRLSYLRREIAIEQLRLDRLEFRKIRDKALQKRQVWLDVCREYGFVPAGEENGENIRRDLAAFLEANTELRSITDSGSSFIYRREDRDNGDYSWKVLGGLAAGERAGERENSHILFLAYRSRRSGVNSEKLIFPFIHKTETAEEKTFSFMGGMFEHTETADGSDRWKVLYIPF